MYRKCQIFPGSGCKHVVQSWTYLGGLTCRCIDRCARRVWYYIVESMNHRRPETLLTPIDAALRWCSWLHRHTLVLHLGSIEIQELARTSRLSVFTLPASNDYIPCLLACSAELLHEVRRSRSNVPDRECTTCFVTYLLLTLQAAAGRYKGGSWNRVVLCSTRSDGMGVVPHGFQRRPNTCGLSSLTSNPET